MKPELFYGVLWIPVVIGYVSARGPLKPSDYKTLPTSGEPGGQLGRASSGQKSP